MAATNANLFKPWYGVDFDHTLAFMEHYVPGVVGAPVPAMVAQVKQWLAEGKDVRVLTARCAHDGTPDGIREAELNTGAVQRWCLEHLGQILPVTCQKSFGLLRIYDDIARQVIEDTGVIVEADRP